MLAILKREMQNYFASPIGYIFLAVFYFFAGMFFSSVLYANTTDITYVFSSLFTVLIFIIPLLTMRSMSEDKKQKTDQLLLTSPINLSGLVMGKLRMLARPVLIPVLILARKWWAMTWLWSAVTVIQLLRIMVRPAQTTGLMTRP